MRGNNRRPPRVYLAVDTGNLVHAVLEEIAPKIEETETAEEFKALARALCGEKLRRRNAFTVHIQLLPAGYGAFTRFRKRSVRLFLKSFST